MNKKILIGSIVIVVLLILFIFTTVVGNKFIESDANGSPLFNIRINRAIHNDNEGMISDYVGRGETSLLPKRNNKLVLIHKFIGKINNMDDRALNGFINYICSNMQLDENLNTEHMLQIKNILRNNPDLFTNYYNDRTNEKKPLDITSGIMCDFIEFLYPLVFAFAIFIVGIKSWFAGTNCLESIMCVPTASGWPCD